MTHFQLFLTLIVLRWFFKFYKGVQTETMAQFMTKSADELTNTENFLRAISGIFSFLYYIALWFVSGWILPYVNKFLN